MVRDIVDDVINDAVNYSQQKKDKHKYYDKEPEVKLDYYDEDIPQYEDEDEEKSDTTVILRGRSAKNWGKNRNRMIKKLNEGKTVKQSTKDEYKPKYNKKTGLYY